jgi:uncharacterized protein YndB with AHSA1/START domain
MATESLHLSTVIARSPEAVYEFAADPENLPEWASGIGDSIEHVDGEWVAQAAEVTLTIAFAPANNFGVLDHEVVMNGERFYNPMRVIEHPDGSEVIFTLRRFADESDDEFETDAATIVTDLATLKRLLEA